MHGQQKGGWPPALYVWFFSILFALSYSLENESLGRFRRQVFPSDHVKVFSLDSNVSVAEHVVAVSHDSLVQITKDLLNASIWSSQSQVEFDAAAVYVNVSAESTTSHFKIGSSSLLSNAQRLTLTESGNRTNDHHINLNLLLSENVSLRFTTEQLTVEAGYGKKARISAQTWQKGYSSRVQLSSNGSLGSPRILEIMSNSSSELVQIILEDCKVSLTYGHFLLIISPDYRTVTLSSSLYEIRMDTVMSSFGINIDDSGLSLRSHDEKLMLGIQSNSSDAEVVVDQLSRLVLKENDGSAFKIGGDLLNVNYMRLISNALRMEILSELESHIRASTNHSRLSVRSNLTNVQLTSAHHYLDVLGGSPNFLLLSGNVSLSLQALKNVSQTPTLLPPFVEPGNKFESIGPDYGDEYGFVTTQVTSIETTAPTTENTPTSTLLIDSATETEFEDATTNEVISEPPIPTNGHDSSTDSSSTPIVSTSSPTTDSFIIGQYGLNNETFPLIATISNITIAETTTASATDESRTGFEADFPTPGSLPNVRRARAAEVVSKSEAHVLLNFENNGVFQNLTEKQRKQLRITLAKAVEVAVWKEKNVALTETVQVYIIDVQPSAEINGTELRFAVVRPSCLRDVGLIVYLLKSLNPEELDDIIGFKVLSMEDVNSPESVYRSQFHTVLVLLGVVLIGAAIVAVCAPLLSKQRLTKRRIANYFLPKREVVCPETEPNRTH